ncbi:MAG: DUF3365 domain-containing protein [Deltaproteobacteria bacterium]|nr:DUF3365 domain-containing protein [Deltaproteobacteria bacterium]
MMMRNGSRTLIIMAVWICILAAFLSWVEVDTRHDEKQLAQSAANAFFQQVVISRKWNASHGGVYVPITSETPPNEYLPRKNRDLTADNGLKLTRVNPSYMTRQFAELAQKNAAGTQFHITSLKPIRPENKATEWEERWLKSFEQGVKEQSEFFADGPTITWFRYMAPLLTGPECLKCHAQQGYKEGDIRGGLSISMPYPTHTHLDLIIGFGSVAAIGLIFIFIGSTLYGRKQRLFDATFNNPVPTCVTDKNYTILMANKTYWAEFGPLPDHKKTIKCYDHRPGKSCHTEDCPLTRILNGARKHVHEPIKEKDGVSQSFITTAKPLLDAKGKVVGIVESFLEITEKKKLEEEKEHLIHELQESLAQVKLLSGFIPICASCKKIRDDQGFWTQVESYIASHSEAQFSHGICPDCVTKLYPELADKILKGN